MTKGNSRGDSLGELPCSGELVHGNGTRRTRQNRGVSTRPAASPPPQITPGGRLVEGELAQVLGYQLAQASVLTERVFQQRVAEPLGLRKVEFTALSLVASNEGLTAAQLGAALAFTAPNTAAWIERLVRQGLVIREQHAQDRRALHIRTTPEGRALLAQALAAIREGEALALARLSAGERLMLSELLHKAAQCRPPKR